jgi:outer membrane biosynthesis protein TonB
MRSTNLPSRSVFVALCFVWLLAASAVGAQPDASVFFHQGAQHFLATNGMTQAKLSVTNGLKLYPNDEKLKKLWEILNQQGQGEGQDKDQKSEQQEKKDQQSKDQKKNEEKKDQQQKSEEQKKQEQEEAAKKDKQSEEEKKGQQSQPNQGKPEDQQEADGSPQGAKAMRMTPQQAMQLLEALKAEEKTMPFKPVMKTNRQDRIFKDW